MCRKSPSLKDCKVGWGVLGGSYHNQQSVCSGCHRGLEKYFKSRAALWHPSKQTGVSALPSAFPEQENVLLNYTPSPLAAV